MPPESTPTLPVLTKALFRSVYNPMSALVFAVNQSGKELVVANTAFLLQLSSLSEASLKNLNIQNLFTTQDLWKLEPGESIQVVLQVADDKELTLEIKQIEAQLEEEKVFICFAEPVTKGSKSVRDALELAETEKKALLNEVYHRVKNNLNIIVSLLSLQLSRVEEEAMREMLLESKSRVYTLALLHEHLYLSPRVADINAGDYLLKLSQTVFSTFRKPGQQLQLHHQMTDIWLNVDTLLPLGLICHELVVNAVQHAYPEGAQGEVNVAFDQNAEGEYELLVSDKGRGLPEGVNFSKGNSLGQKLIVNLSKQLKAQLSIESSNEGGTAVVLRFSKEGK